MTSDWQSGYVRANGIQIHCHRTSGDKRPIVLTHGITDNGLCWQRLARELEADYDLILVDARGHGLSDKPETGYGREDHAQDIAGLIEALELGQPCVIGHSMGAATASVLGADFPERVGALVLEDPPWRTLEGARLPDEVRTHMSEWGERIRQRQSWTRERIITEGKGDNPKWSDEEFEPWSLAKHQVSPHVVNFIHSNERVWKNVIEAIQCPTLLVTGDAALGAIVSEETAAAAAQLNPQIEVAYIEDAGHNIRRDQFNGFVKRVREFLAKVYPA